MLDKEILLKWKEVTKGPALTLTFPVDDGAELIDLALKGLAFHKVEEVALMCLSKIANEGMGLNANGVITEDESFNATRLARDAILHIIALKIKGTGA